MHVHMVGDLMQVFLDIIIPIAAHALITISSIEYPTKFDYEIFIELLSKGVINTECNGKHEVPNRYKIEQKKTATDTR